MQHSLTQSLRQAFRGEYIHADAHESFRFELDCRQGHQGGGCSGVDQ